ncbi:hypothetical protein G4B88_019060 [Cannabis sativa]|uniref:Lipoxygenase n=1 Tax=Cannabis sativa TaxID=3483 RepID=A0A7J6H0U2_CANSA|nr:hypothetical protein G4B88_019060 [Cannabis sativa]
MYACMSISIDENVGVVRASATHTDWWSVFRNDNSNENESVVASINSWFVCGNHNEDALLGGYSSKLEKCSDHDDDPNHKEYSKFKLTFTNWNEIKMGVPPALKITNNNKDEFLLKYITLDNVPGAEDSVKFLCNSWVYPQERYSYPRNSERHKLHRLREGELRHLRSENNKGELKEWDRVYDYATYNDLGDDRPILGGKDLPYPRRGRTGRSLTHGDLNLVINYNIIQYLIDGHERRPDKNQVIYIPRDEQINHLKTEPRPSSEAVAKIITTLSEDVTVNDDNYYGSFREVLALFQGTKLPVPGVIEAGDENAWRDDEEFGREMIAGVHPVHIRLLKKFPPKSKLDKRKYGDQDSKISEDDIINMLEDFTSVDKAIEQKRLFILDHHDTFMPYLKRINKTSTKAYATRTILFLTKEEKLMPVAIELSLPKDGPDENGADSTVFTPPCDNDPHKYATWQLAKGYVAVNDSGYHQLYMIEPFVIATNRQLSVIHPIYKLLHPHFRGTMSINARARTILVNADGKIERIFFQGKYAMESSSAVYKNNWAFNKQGLPADLIKRQTKQPCELVKNYPYAVDGLEIWNAINKWVKEYCDIYYKGEDKKVQNDKEIQNWWKEIKEVGHGDKKEYDGWPEMKTFDELVESCTIIIWISSALHAAVNFGQYSFAAFYPNRPTLSRQFMPTEGTTLGADDEESYFLSTFTSKKQSLEMIYLIAQLSSHESDEVYLGKNEDVDWTSDKKALDAFKNFQAQLREIEDDITTKNQNHEKNRCGPIQFPYTLLFPTSEPGITAKGIPNSISI